MSEGEAGGTLSLRQGNAETFHLWWETQPFAREEPVYTKGESVYLSLRPEWEEVDEAPEDVALQTFFSFGERGSEHVVMEHKLGEGGMGEVWSGWQGSLGREVAVKRLKLGKEQAVLRAKLLREARLTGMLEHPNIVPVHLLGADASGCPAFAMKRIQGVSWEDILLGREPMPEGLQGSTRLEQHIRILKQVCNAIHFAHSRGIVHRDIKPSNVMIGSFGEVYVVDWGIAVCLDPAQSPRLPTVAREKGIFGTPAYMAPEMATGTSAGICEQTDVYLLGATLHELLSGEPPHRGESLYEVLYEATQSLPYEYDPAIPEELVAICHKAMHVEPAQRYPSAEAFRQALARFLTNRTSRQLALETMAHLVQLKAHARIEGDAATEQSLHIHQLFGQVQFGFQQALRTWPENEQARAGLQEALECMIGFEMRHKHIRAAALLMDALPEPNAALEAELQALDEARRREEATFDALKQMHHEVDLSVQAAPRGRLMWLMALLWGGLPLVIELLHDVGWYAISTRSDALMSGGTVVASLGVIWWWRRALWRNEVNRSLLLALVVAILTLSFLWTLCLRLGLSLSQILALEAIPMFGFFAFVAILVDRRLLPVLWLYATVAVTALIWPPVAPYATSVGNAAAFVLLGWIWQQPEDTERDVAAS